MSKFRFDSTLWIKKKEEILQLSLYVYALQDSRLNLRGYRIQIKYIDSDSNCTEAIYFKFNKNKKRTKKINDALFFIYFLQKKDNIAKKNFK